MRMGTRQMTSTAENTADTDTRAADIARATEILNRLDRGALAPILAQVTTAYEVQEATKADMIRRLTGSDRGSC